MHIGAALALGRRALGNAWPNPAVGCVIVRDGIVLGRGWTGPGGRPHAEEAALARAGDARGATVYVTLEPCAHAGRGTAPCYVLLARAGVVRVVCAMRDPDPRTDGAGIAALRAAGVTVDEGLLADAAAADNAGFVSRVRDGRPMVTLKLATTLDGRIATASGESRWITGPRARRRAHALRGHHDAVMIGEGTARIDDPDLTCRIPGFRPIPVVRVVADSMLRTSLTARLVATARDAPTWMLHRPEADAARRAAFAEAGVRLLAMPGAAEGLEPAAMLAALGAAGLTRVLVEGGARLAASLLRAGLVDRIAWFHAPGVIGGDGLAAVAGFGLETLAGMPRFEPMGVEALGADVLTMFKCRD